MIPPSTGNGVFATGVGPHSVDTCLAGQAGTVVSQTLINIDTAADCILNVPVWAALPWVAAERSCRVGAQKVWSTVMSPQTTLINILAFVVVSKFIAGATADLPLTAKGAVCVDTNLTEDAVMAAGQTLINILTVQSILF